MIWKRPIIEGESLKKVTGHLQHVLVDMIDLSLQAKQAHWTVRGLQFKSVHEFLDEIVVTAREATDTVAERIVQLGVVPDGRIGAVEKQADLEAYPGDMHTAPETISLMANRLKTSVDHVRTAIETVDELDPISGDQLISIAESLEEHLWMLQAFEE